MMEIKRRYITLLRIVNHERSRFKSVRRDAICLIREVSRVSAATVPVRGRQSDDSHCGEDSGCCTRETESRSVPRARGTVSPGVQYRDHTLLPVQRGARERAPRVAARKDNAVRRVWRGSRARAKTNGTLRSTSSLQRSTFQRARRATQDPQALIRG